MGAIRRVGLLGGGVIGAAWAARMALNGLDAVICDLDPEAERKVAEVLANARRAWTRLTLAPLPAEGTIRVVKRIEDAAEGADFAQESLPEREDLKIALLARAEHVLRDDVIIGSSTSGLLPTRLQSGLKHPQRFVVGHPFNPVYLMPLVEICGGEKTSDDTRERAAAFYRSIGMRPLQVRREIDGFIADRLMEALWREALWLVHDDIATAEEIDDAVRYGPGLRWAFMGTFLIYRIAGGEPGMRHFMAQFGPSLKWPWTKLMDVPELDDALLDKLVEQSDAQAAGQSIRDLERLRDDCLVTILQGLRGRDYAAGSVLGAYEKALLAAPRTAAAVRADAGALRTYEGRVEPGWIDYNGHMNDSRYTYAFGLATDALLVGIGVDAAYIAGGHSYFTLETHQIHLHEMKLGEAFQIATQVLDSDDKRIHVFSTLTRTSDGTPAATAEQMLMHVDTQAGRAAPFPPEILARLRVLTEAHAALPKPEAAGRPIGIRRRAGV